MTIEQLITTLATSEREFGDVWVEGKHVEMIIAALRAASLSATILHSLRSSGDICGVTEAHTRKLNRSIDAVLEAWDAATKGEE